MVSVTTPQTMTYNSLQEDMRRYLERGTSEDEMVNKQMPRIIGNVQRTLSEKLRILGYVGAYVSKMKVYEPRIAKPENWRSTLSINYGLSLNTNVRSIMRPCSYEYLRSIYPDDRSLGGPEFGMLGSCFPANLAAAIPLRHTTAGRGAQDDDAKHDPSPGDLQCLESPTFRRWTPA